MIVADTNLISYLVIPTEYSQLASEVYLKDSNWIAPPLWRSEMVSILYQNIKVGRLDKEQAIAVYIRASNLVTEEVSPPIAGIIEAFSNYALSPYDAEFAALAIENNIKLVSNDRKLIKHSGGWALGLQDFVGN